MNQENTLSETEILELVHAYQTIQKFLEKFLPLEQLYTSEFINSINDAMVDLDHKNYVEVNSFDDFVNK
ncbi:MAG: hypothetical protein HZB41_11195 [Ignavibacteriae bacterium]|nr:hypothetical protein [Ignavibacteriota bacterium]